MCASLRQLGVECSVGILTVAKPFAKGANRLGLSESLLKVVAEVLDDLVHVGLHDQDRRGGVVADDGALHAGMLRAVNLAEHVVLDLAVDHGAAVLVEVGLQSCYMLGLVFTTIANAIWESYRTLIHLKSVP